MKRPVRDVVEETEHGGALRNAAVSHIALRVPDVDAAEDFYGRVLGMRRHGDAPGGGSRMGWGVGHHVLDLHEGDKGLVHYGFEVRDRNGIQHLRERLRARGIAVVELEPDYLDQAIGAGEGIRVADPDGSSVHFHSAVHRQGEGVADPGRRPIKFQHTTLGTADMSPMIDFFVNIVGFRMSDQLADGNFCWLRSNNDHHTLAVVNVGHGGDIDHYSYDLAEWEDFKSWCDRLTDLDVPVQWGPGRH